MVSSERLEIRKVVGGAIGDIVNYPFRHPKETVKTVVVGGLAVASTLMASQVTMLIAEHGGIRRYREEPQETDQQETEEQHEQ